MEPNEIRDAVELLVDELLDVAGLGRNDLLVVGCSSSEILGERMGTHSSEVVGQAVFEGLQNVLVARGIEAGRLAVEGKGPDQPLADNATDAGRALNRRVSAIRAAGG